MKIQFALRFNFIERFQIVDKWEYMALCQGRDQSLKNHIRTCEWYLEEQKKKEFYQKLRANLSLVYRYQIENFVADPWIPYEN